MYAQRFRHIMTLVPLTIAVACGPPEEEVPLGEMEETGEMTIPAEPVEEAAPETPAPVEFSIMLETVNESGVTGTASAAPQGESVVVDVMVTGVTAGEELPAHIHQGTCATGGSVVSPLSSIQISEGQGSSTTTVDAGQIPEGQSAFVQVHAPDGQPVACANLPEQGGM